MMYHLFLLCCGASVGVVLRDLTARIVGQAFGSEFPLGTLIVNVLGSVLIGFFFVICSSKEAYDSFWRPLLFIGALGGFTTFSTFSLELLLMMERGEWALSVGYAFISLISCFAGVYFGAQFARGLA